MTRGVRTLAPAGAITPTGTWSVGVRAGDRAWTGACGTPVTGTWN